MKPLRQIIDARLPLLFTPESFFYCFCLNPPSPGFLFLRLRAGRFAGAMESGKSELLDVVEGGEKRFEMLAISQNAINEPSAGVHDLAGELDIADQKPPELHSHDVSARSWRLRHQPIPGLQIPSQSCDYHVGPVRNQTVRWHSQCVDAALQLTNHVLLVASIIGEKYNFFLCHLAIVGDVEKISDFVKQALLPFFDRQVLAHNHHPVSFFAERGPIVEFSDIFAAQSDVLVFTLYDDLFLHVFGTRAFFRFHFVSRWPIEPLPGSLGQFISKLDQVRTRIVSEHEIDLLAPTVRVLRRGKIRVPPKPNLFENRSDQGDSPVDPLRSLIRRRSVARAIDQVEHLVCISQTHNQRRVAPHPVVGDPDAFLAFAHRLGDRAVDVDYGLFAKALILKRPDLFASFIERLLETQNRRLVETPEEVPRRRRIRNPRGAESIHVALIVPQLLDILQTQSARNHVVCDVQHVVRFVIRHMKLEQLHIAVDRAIQLQSADQLVDRPDTTIADRPCSFGNHISDIGVLKHRLRLVVKVFSLKSFLEISLVSLQNFVVSFVHLECAPLIVVVTCKFLLQPITTHIPGMFHLFSKKTTLVLGLVSVARLAPKGRRRKAQGVSPGNKCSKNGSPEGAKQSVPILQRSAYDEYLSVVETDLPAPPFQGSLQIGTLNPGLAPWAVLLDPFGVRCFATETSQTSQLRSSQTGQVRYESHG